MLSKSQVKYIQSLHHKKFREEHKAFVVEGTKMLEEAMAFAPDQIQHIYATGDWLSTHEASLGRFKDKTAKIADADMAKLSALHTPPGVLLVMEVRYTLTTDFSSLTLVLDGVQDPGNLGTIIRTADWFGVKNIVCGKGTVDSYNPKVIQSSMGSIFRMNIIYADILSVFDQHPEIPIFVSYLNGTELTEIDLPETAFMVIGNESNGVSAEVSARASKKIRIPGFGHAESLNASIATAILLYAWKC